MKVWWELKPQGYMSTPDMLFISTVIKQEKHHHFLRD